MAKFIVGGVLVLLSWAIAIIFQLPYWIPSLVTLLVALVLLLMVGLAKLRERRAARELERALAAQAAQQAATARPDLQHEIAEMNAEFQKAISALKGSKKGGKKALYALPWYTIIGPPGCGKSTALRNSGLQFPYLSASGGGVRGLGGTRNCDWWMTSEAVILDTAGRWTSEDEDRDEWLAFLDLTKRFRPKKPLNGIIAAVSVGDLGGAREEEVVALARRVRERIDEVQARLALSLPVYVLFTKCDLVPGFVETFGEMGKEQRGQVWGFTAPLTKPIGPPGEYFAKGFDQLVVSLERRSLKRMGEERKISSRDLIYAFPQQVGVLKQNLQDFVHNLFLENVFKETPRLRGVYFTSGTQEGRPIDRVMSRMAEAFGQPQVVLPAPQVESKSYFLRDTFANVVFKDAAVAVRSPEEVARQRRRTYLTAGAIFFLALGISGLPALSWALNGKYLDETREIVDEARAATTCEALEPLGPGAFERLRQRALELEDYADGGPPPTMGLGMYHEEVFPPVQAVYLDVLRRCVMGPLVMADTTEMEAFGGRYEAGARPDAQEMRGMYSRLKLHLLLSGPKDEAIEEPATLDDDLREFAREQLVLRWAAGTSTRRSDPDHALLEPNIEYYLRNIASHRELVFERDVSAVGRVRGVFSAEGGFEMAIQGIVEAVRPRGADVTLTRMLGRGVTRLRSRAQVRFAFTRDGWERHVRDMLEGEAAQFFGEPWVLGHPPPEDPREAERERYCQVEALRSYYLNRYAQEWMSFIDSLEYEAQRTREDSLILLTELTSGDPRRVTMLVRQIDREVTIDEARAAGGSATAQAAQAEAQRAAERRLRSRLGGVGPGRLLQSAQNDLRRRMAGTACPPVPNELTPAQVRTRFIGFLDFAPVIERTQTDGQRREFTPAERYEEQLLFLKESIQSMIDGTNITNYATVQATARTETERLINERPADWRERLGRILRPPVEGWQATPPEGAPGAPAAPATPGAPGAPAAPPAPGR